MTAKEIIDFCELIIRKCSIEMTGQDWDRPVEAQTPANAYLRGQADAAWAIKKQIQEATRPQPEGRKEKTP